MNHDDIISEIATMTPMTDADYRRYVFDTQIVATLKAWGFESRFLVEQPDMHPKQRNAYKQMVASLKCKGAIVALIGERGLGKTTLAAQFAIKTAWQNHHESLKPDGNRFKPHVIYRKTAGLLSKYKPLFSDFGAINTEQLIDSLDYLCRHQEFLVIDELHECEDRKAFHALLTDLVDRRYAALRDTVLIANMKPEAFAKAAGDSIMSRLGEHGAIVECDWPSYR